MIRGVIFDLDGTLLDSLRDMAAAANHTLERFGLPTHSVEAYRDFIGYGAKELMLRAAPDTPTPINTLLDAYKTRYSQHLTGHSSLYDGIDALLHDLEARSIQKAILSNKPHAMTLQCHAHYLDAWTFDAVYGHRDDAPRKPDPAGALEIAGIMQLDPAEILFVGDTRIDMLTARHAGMTAVGVSWGFRDVEELRAHGADWIVTSPMQITALF